MSLDAAPRLIVVCLAAAALCLAGCARQTVDAGIVADALLAAQVKTTLVNDAEIGTHVIEVRANGGQVTLSGTLPSEAAVERALALARGVAGVQDVRSVLRVVPPEDAARNVRVPEARTGGAAERLPPSALAIGGSLGVIVPRDEALDTGFTLGPAIMLGQRTGFGPWVGFNWYQTDLPAPERGEFGQIRIRPIMGGVAYSVARGRLSTAFTLAAGYAFNTLSIAENLRALSRPVRVDNSFVWRPGVNLAYRTSRRWSATGFAGYVVTTPQVTFVEGDRIVERSVTASALQVGGGLVWWVF